MFETILMEFALIVTTVSYYGKLCCYVDLDLSTPFHQSDINHKMVKIIFQHKLYYIAYHSVAK